MLSRLATLAALLVAGAGVAAPLDVVVQGADGEPLRDAVVFLDSAAAKAAARPLAGFEVAQEERRFVPEVAVVTVGTDVQFPNRDTVRHHVYSFSPAKAFELKLYIGKPANPVRFDRPGIAVLGCNIHDQMVGWVVVLETPYFGRSAAGGQVRLDAPPGSYTLRAWHPDLPPGAPAASVTVEVGAAATAVKLRVPVGGARVTAEAPR